MAADKIALALGRFPACTALPEMLVLSARDQAGRVARAGPHVASTPVKEPQWLQNDGRATMV